MRLLTISFFKERTFSNHTKSYKTEINAIILLITVIYSAHVIISLLILSSLVGAEAAYADEGWYPGKVIQKGMYVKYSISEFDYVESGGHPFNATIWFESQDEDGNWKTLTIIDEQGKITISNMTLWKVNMKPIGTEYSDQFKLYKTIIADTLGWIGNFAKNNDPKPLGNDSTWGVITGPGGGPAEVRALGTETLQLAGKSWNTTIVGFRYGEVSKVWIADNFPLPVKARVYTYPHEQPVPVWFEYKLLEFGHSDTPVPEFPLGVTDTMATMVAVIIAARRFAKIRMSKMQMN